MYVQPSVEIAETSNNIKVFPKNHLVSVELYGIPSVSIYDTQILI